MVKWALDPQGGQRQWMHLEAKAVLEDLLTNVQVGDAAGDGDDDDDDEREEEGQEEDDWGNEDAGGVIAGGTAVSTELGPGVDETDSKAGEVPPFPDNEAMENLNQDAEETETVNQAKDEDKQKGEDEGEGRDEEEKEEEEGGDEGGGVIAAGVAVATVLGPDVDETDRKAGEVPPFPDDETMENHNQKAEETETGNQAEDEDNFVDGGEVVQVVQDPVTPQRSYTCGRCSEGIDLDSTFYRCVGHSCRGTFTCQSWIF